ncbi:hypothetical protein LOK49_LG01G01651 [Camellia lanceoleosa]|uniref:Uncharacterized protein n=1 Tax=Camellia lanceoleosa TaxID=1840588 RepID=A0ACC0J3M5_9ERIC|nr:hypothetical protein LOK49_LG01G01651 [Camellia lanceoleosa]
MYQYLEDKCYPPPPPPTNNGGSKDQLLCLTRNPINDCWQCDPNWANNRQRLIDCAIGFGQAAFDSKDGQIYVVIDSSNHDPANPTSGLDDCSGLVPPSR